MKKFILLTFGFLGLVFYELSGGSDFDAEALRLSRTDTVPTPLKPAAPAPEVQLAAAEEKPTLADQIADNATVTRAAFSLSDTGAGTQAKPALVTAASLPAAEPAVATQEDTRQTLILPSLVQKASVQTASVEVPAVETETAPVDIRSVSGNRVNVRGGPGTDYDVVNRMTRGQEVEILSDPGTGWVKLRPLDGGTVGWMADFLLTSG